MLLDSTVNFWQTNVDHMLNKIACLPLLSKARNAFPIRERHEVNVCKKYAHQISTRCKERGKDFGES